MICNLLSIDIFGYFAGRSAIARSGDVRKWSDLHVYTAQ